VDKDEKTQRAARAEAFLNVPLFKKTYEDFRGKQLPPRPHGLEKAFVNFGVSSKQKATARIAFDKSARQAGYFSAGEDRLVEPIVSGPNAVRASNLQPNEWTPDKSGPSPAPEREEEAKSSSLHPFIQGLLDSLPEPGTNWAVEGRGKWLETASNIFDLIYKGVGTIDITVTAEQALNDKS
jgi:hypothetical protein